MLVWLNAGDRKQNIFGLSTSRYNFGLVYGGHFTENYVLLRPFTKYMLL